MHGRRSSQRSTLTAVQHPSQGRNLLKLWLVVLGCALCLAGITYGTRAWIRTELIPRYARELSEQSLDVAVRATITDITHADVIVEQPSHVEVVCTALWADGLHTTTECSTGFGPLPAPTSPKLDKQELTQSGWSVLSPDSTAPDNAVAEKRYGSVRCYLYYSRTLHPDRTLVEQSNPGRISVYCQRLVRIF